jgi:hypothetical protein
MILDMGIWLGIAVRLMVAQKEIEVDSPGGLFCQSQSSQCSHPPILSMTRIGIASMVQIYNDLRRQVMISQKGGRSWNGNVLTKYTDFCQ